MLQCIHRTGGRSVVARATNGTHNGHVILASPTEAFYRLRVPLIERTVVARVTKKTLNAFQRTISQHWGTYVLGLCTLSLEKVARLLDRTNNYPFGPASRSDLNALQRRIRHAIPDRSTLRILFRTWPCLRRPRSVPGLPTNGATTFPLPCRRVPSRSLWLAACRAWYYCGSLWVTSMLLAWRCRACSRPSLIA